MYNNRGNSIGYQRWRWWWWGGGFSQGNMYHSACCCVCAWALDLRTNSPTHATRCYFLKQSGMKKGRNKVIVKVGQKTVKLICNFKNVF